MRSVLMKLFGMCFCVFILLSVMGASSCDHRSIEEKGEQEQTELMQRARKAVPTPKVNHFLTRKAVAKWMKRMDQPQKEFYNYLMAANGQIVYYFVSQYRPVSVSSFLTPPKKEWDHAYDNPLGPAPALDGVYYGSGGSSGGARFCFNAATNAYFEVVDLGGYVMITTDQPLEIDAPELKIAGVSE